MWNKSLLPPAASFPPCSWILCKGISSVRKLWWWWIFLMRMKEGEGSLLDRPGKADLELPCVNQGLSVMFPSILQSWWLDIWYKIGCEVMRSLQPNGWETWHLTYSIVSLFLGWCRAGTKGLINIFKSTSWWIRVTTYIFSIIQKNPGIFIFRWGPKSERWNVRVKTWGLPSSHPISHTWFMLQLPVF